MKTGRMKEVQTDRQTERQTLRDRNRERLRGRWGRGEREGSLIEDGREGKNERGSDRQTDRKCRCWLQTAPVGTPCRQGR